jgi:hypothetical protein
MSGPLFEFADRYPQSPGYRKRETSRRAAREMKAKAPTLRDQCLKVIQESPIALTADEVAAALGKSVLSVRPRVAELATMGLVVDSGARGENVSMKQAIKWRAVGGGGNGHTSQQAGADRATR